MNLGVITKKIEKADVISFDIFDTLLLRPFFQPSDLFGFMDYAYRAPGFVNARKQAERVFYAKGTSKTEATIDDIYSVMPEYSHLKAKEMDLEFAGLVANDEMLKVFNCAKQLNKRIIIASDMYLPIEFIRSVLQKNNITGFEKLYLSNNINKRKDRGDMYDFIVQDLGIEPQKILHIGDNKFSDYKMAKKHNLNAVLYKRKKSRAYKVVWGSSVLATVLDQQPKTDNYWEDFGYRIAGPVAYAFAQHIYNNAVANKLKKILFIARDGWLIKQAFDIINDKDISTHYVYAPRILNYTANLDYDPKQPEQPRIICEYFGINTNGLSCTDYMSTHNSQFSELAKKEKAETGYQDYIHQIVKNEEVVGVVDTISGQMSGQRLIQRESGAKTIGFYVATIPGKKCLSEFEHYDYFTTDLGDKILQNNLPDLIELIFSAPEKPIITLQKGKPVHQKIENPAEQKRNEICELIASGAKKFIVSLMSRTNNLGLEINSATLYDILSDYMKHPTNANVKAMFEVKKSPFADNSLYVPLFSAPGLIKIEDMKRLVWKSPLQKLVLNLINPLKIEMRGLKLLNIILLPEIRPICHFSVLDKYGLFLGKRETY